jgi:hypothetical protein
LCALCGEDYDNEIKPPDPKTREDDSSSLRRQRVLCLQILYFIFLKAGEVLAAHTQLRHIVRYSVIPAVLTNAGYPHPSVYQYSVALVCQIIKYFHLRFKDEIEALLTVYLQELEYCGEDMLLSQNLEQISFYEQFKPLFCDGQVLVDLFVNYDLEGELLNVVERMITAATKHATLSVTFRKERREPGEPAMEKQTPLEEHALSSIESILIALADWASRRSKVYLGEWDEDSENTTSLSVNISSMNNGTHNQSRKSARATGGKNDSPADVLGSSFSKKSSNDSSEIDSMC